MLGVQIVCKKKITNLEFFHIANDQQMLAFANFDVVYVAHLRTKVLHTHSQSRLLVALLEKPSKEANVT